MSTRSEGDLRLGRAKSVRCPKVMFVGPIPPPYSGPELGMKQFLESALSRKLDILFIKTNFRTSSADKGKLGFSAAFWTALFHLRLIWSLAVFRPAAIYYPITPTASGWLGRDAPCLLLCRLFGVPSIIHLRGSHLRLNFQTFGRFPQRLTKLACSTVSIALVQAECLRDQFEGLVPRERVRVLPQAIDCQEYNAGDGDVLDDPRVLFLGNLSYPKGYCDLLRALPTVADAVPSVKFIFCGSFVERARSVHFDQTSGRKLDHESPRAAHEAVLRSPYHNNYEWRGVVTGKEKLRLLRSASVVILPSYSEGFSRALMEAIAVGRAVVCTPVGAHKEYIVDGVNGLIVTPGDIAGISRALISLLTDAQLRDRMGAANHEYARAKFELGKVADKLHEYILEAIGRDFSRVTVCSDKIID